jgi:hypothetical protein
MAVSAIVFEILAATLASQSVSVSNSHELLEALRTAPPGARIKLQPGLYSDVVVKGVRGPFVIESASVDHPAVLTDLRVSETKDLTLADVEFSAAGVAPGPFGPAATVPFQILDSANIDLERLNVHGAPNGSLETDVSGLLIRNSDHVTIANSDFHNLHNAINHIDDQNLTVANNHFHHLRDDGLRGGGSSYVSVTDNRCDSQHPDAKDQDHPDCIQFWTTNTKTPAHDITITGNTYERGEGMPIQGIFMRDEVGALPYQRVTISGNIVRGASWNGIAVSGATAPIIKGNVVCPYADQMSWIRVQDTTGAALSDNKAGRYAFKNNTDLVEKGDRVSGDCKSGS